MSRYVVLYHAPVAVAERFAQATPEEAAVGVKLWQDWTEKVGSALVDPGRPFGRNVSVTSSGAAPGDSTVVGMSILEAGSMAEAVELVKDHHHLGWAPDCEITVLEEMAVPELQ